MLNQRILEKLVNFTDEEIANRNGRKMVDRSIFINESSNIVDGDKLVFDDQQLAVRKHARFMDYPKHKHNYIELIYVYSGQSTHIIDERKIRIEKNKLLLLNQKVEHAVEYCKEEDILFNFIIKPAFLEFLCTMIKNENQVLNFIFDALYSYKNAGEYLILKPKNGQLVRSYIESIITKLYEPQLNNELELKLLVGLLLCELMNHPEDIEAGQSRSPDKLVISLILKYIVSHYRDGTLDELSNQIHIPNYQLCKMIKKQTGSTFVELIQNERLRIAAKLLKTTAMPIAEIMAEVGYENTTYFYHLFKKFYHQTPREYRRANSMAK